MAVLKEISESEAAELVGRRSSQDRQADQAGENEIAGNSIRQRASGSSASALDDVLKRVSDLEHVLPPSAGEGTRRGSNGSRVQSDLQKEIIADTIGNEMEQERESKAKKPGAAEAVLLGALATGVNGPTWFVIKAVLVALAASLVLLLLVAIKSSSMMVLLNVIFLIIIAGGLAFGLSWYVSQIGLVTVEKQMEELNLTDEASDNATKKSE